MRVHMVFQASYIVYNNFYNMMNMQHSITFWQVLGDIEEADEQVLDLLLVQLVVAKREALCRCRRSCYTSCDANAAYVTTDGWCSEKNINDMN